MSCSRIQQELHHTHTDRFGVRRSTPHRPLSNVVSGVLKLSIEKSIQFFRVKVLCTSLYVTFLLLKNTNYFYDYYYLYSHWRVQSRSPLSAAYTLPVPSPDTPSLSSHAILSLSQNATRPTLYVTDNARGASWPALNRRSAQKSIEKVGFTCKGQNAVQINRKTEVGIKKLKARTQNGAFWRYLRRFLGSWNC